MKILHCAFSLIDIGHRVRMLIQSDCEIAFKPEYEHIMFYYKEIKDHILKIMPVFFPNDFSLKNLLLNSMAESQGFPIFINKN